MSTRIRVFMFFAIGHMVLVALGMAHIGVLPTTTIPGKALRVYTGVSGADKGYGFFAPGVRHQERAVFLMTDAEGRQWEGDLGFGESAEANLRLGSTANVLREVDDETAFHFMRSMAAKMFQRHPTAQTIKVQVQAYGIKLPGATNGVPAIDFPTMAEFRSGKQPEWIDLYSLTFEADEAGQTIAVLDNQGMLK